VSCNGASRCEVILASGPAGLVQRTEGLSLHLRPEPAMSSSLL
jgi:hypothetical protein